MKNDIDVLSLTLDDVLKDGFNDTLILNNGQTIYIMNYELQSLERAHLQQLRRDYIADRTPKFTPRVEPEEIHKTQSVSKSLLELLSEPDTEQPYLIEGLIPKGEFVGIVGKSGVNKSTFCRQLALTIATQQTSFCGFSLRTSHGNSLYIFSEDGVSWVKRYLRKNCKGLQYENAQLENMRVANMNDFEDGDSIISRLREELTMRKYDLIIFDSFSDLLNLFGAELNKNSDVRKIVSQLSFLKSDGCCVIFNHHVSDKSVSIGTFQGATAFRQIVRTQLEITEHGLQRVISVEKNSYGEKSEAMIFNLTEDFLFEPTGETITRQELSDIVANSNFRNTTPRSVGKPRIATASLEMVKFVFGSSKQKTTAEIKQLLHKHFNMSDATADRWKDEAIKLGLIQKLSHGIYIFTESSNHQYTYKNIEDNIEDLPKHSDYEEVNDSSISETSIPRDNNEDIGTEYFANNIMEKTRRNDYPAYLD